MPFWESGFAALTDFPLHFRRQVSQGVYRAEIDGLRFFAIVFVIFGHSLERAERMFPSSQAWLSGSKFGDFLQIAPPGVMLFFAISGFVLATQAQKASVSPLSAGFLKSYFGRRILRIEPPYILLLVATWAFISLTRYTPEGVRRFDVAPASLNVSLLGAIFYVHDLVWGTFPRLFPPGWSLEVEVQFYLLAPLLFAIWAALRGTGERIVLAALIVLCGLNVKLIWPETLGPLHVRYSILNYFSYFWIGVALSYLRKPVAARVAWLSGGGATALGWGGLAVFVALAAPAEQDSLALEIPRLLGVYAGLAAVFASVLDARSGLAKFCAAPWISLIGGACYSIYLLHLQIVQMVFVLAAKVAPNLPFPGVAALFAIAAAAATTLGLIYYIQIERRFMARDWPSQLAAFLRRGRGKAEGVHLVVDNPPATSTVRRAEKRRSAAARP
jgi:peptidoglycan/LPS O-acetylase OafA/YrhL